MKRRDLLRRLAEAAEAEGEILQIAEGSGHSKVTIGTRRSVVPRHNEINEITARAILKQMGVDR